MTNSNKNKKKKARQPLNAFPILDSSTNTGFAVGSIPNLPATENAIAPDSVTFIDQPYDGCAYGGTHTIDLSECSGFE